MIISSVTAVEYQGVSTLNQQISTDCLNANSAIRGSLNRNIINLDQTESRSGSSRDGANLLVGISISVSFSSIPSSNLFGGNTVENGLICMLVRLISDSSQLRSQSILVNSVNL